MGDPNPTKTFNQESFQGNKAAQLEKVRQKLDPFIRELFLRWFGTEVTAKAKILMKSIPIREMDYEALAKVKDYSRIGEYTIDPETAGIDYEGKDFKIKILDQELKQFVGRPMFEVADYVIKTYGKDYNIPGLEYMEYLSKNPEHIPEEIKSDKFVCIFLGTTLCYQDGDFRIPTSAHGVSMFQSSPRDQEPHLYFNASALGNKNIFKSHHKIILFEK